MFTCSQAFFVLHMYVVQITGQMLKPSQKRTIITLQAKPHVLIVIYVCKIN